MMVSRSKHNQERISAILNRCLDLIESGAGTVESVLGLYPEFGEVLRPPLEAAQWLFSRSEVLNPRPGFVKVSRQRLVDRFQEAETYARPGALERGRFTSITLERRLVIQYSALLTLTAVLLFIGYTSTAFIVQRSIPGDPLYQLKLTQEDYRLALSLSEVRVVYLRIENAHQRVLEMQKLIADGRESFLSVTLENFVTQMNAASKAIASIAANDQDKASELSSFLAATLSAPLHNLVAVLDVAEYAAIPGLLELLSVYIPDGTQPVAAVAYVPTTTPFPSPTPTATMTPTPLFSFVTTPTVYFSATPTATSSSRTEGQPTAPASSTPLPTQAPPGDSPMPPPTSTPRPPSQPTATPTPLPSDPPPPTAAPTDTPPPPPTSTPQPTPQPTHTPQPTQAPTNTPLPTQAPTSTPLPTSKPTSTPTPQPTDEPGPTPEPTIPNWKTPKPTSFP